MAAKTAVRTALNETDKSGAFIRVASTFRHWVKKGGEYEPESGRYHLYVSYACPWANRCLAVRNLRGLQDAISVSVVHPTWQKTRPDDAEDPHHGWVFRDPSLPPLKSSAGFGSFPSDGATVDHVLGKASIRDVYESTAGGYTGKYTVPVLFDKKTKTIVNNESSEIIQMFAKEFTAFEKDPANDVVLFPEETPEIKEVDEKIYDGLNNGVYRAGFARSQEAFDKAVTDVFDTLDWLEERLNKSRFLHGDTMSASDLRTYMTLVRFDPVYVVHFKCSKKFIRDYPNVFAYTRDIYQHPRIRSVTNLSHIVLHYFTSHVQLNPFAIIPPCSTDLELPHDRATRSYSQ